MLTFACISPHPPIILPDVGSPFDRQKVKSTIVALESLAPKLAVAKPDVIIISSPHPDWGINIPLHFLRPNYKLQITNYLTTLESPKKHYDWGQQIAKSLLQTKRGAWIASGDMSHCLKKDGPYGFNPAGPEFDQKFIELLKAKNVEGILNLNPKLIEEAGECGLRSFCMLLGAIDALKINWNPEILSYEGPFGVGYLVADMINSDNSNSDVFVLLTKQTIEHYLTTGKIMEIPLHLPKTLLTTRAGVFVSLHLKDDSLRGCIGTFMPTKKNIAEEIIQNALSAAFNDPRFPPVTKEELPNLVYSVDILSKPKPAGKKDLNPKKYGLIVSTSDGRRGLLLPDIEGVETTEEQERICRLKAGISPEEKVKLQIFTVERHQESL